MIGAVAPFLVAVALAGVGDNLQTVAGGSFSLADLLARGPAVLVFWNSWLPRAEEFAKLLPEVEAAAERSGWPGAVIVFQEVNADAVGRLSRGKSALPIVVDRRGELVRRFQVTRAPAVILVEKDGKVRARCGPDPLEVQAITQEMAKR